MGLFSSPKAPPPPPPPAPPPPAPEPAKPAVVGAQLDIPGEIEFDVNQATIKDTPIWAFHGSADDIVNVQSTRDMVAALEAVGGNIKYTEVEGGDHFIWPQIYGDASNSLYSWLFAQHLSDGLDTTLAAAMPTAPSLSVAVTTAAAVPEPASIGLIAVGGMILLKRRR